MSQSTVKFRLAQLGLALAAIGFTAGVATPAYAQALRPEVGKPLQEAQKLLQQKKAREALAKVREADRAGGKTPSEQATIDRMMAAAGSAAGDNEATIHAMESLINSGKVPASEQLRYVQSLASIYYTNKNYSKSIQYIQRYLKEDPGNATMKSLLTSAQFQSGDIAAAAKQTANEVAAIEKSGRAASEDQYQLLANVASRSTDKAAYVAAMEKLVSHYPKRDYWADLLNRLQGRPGFSDRLSLDLYRLKLALGLVKTKADYMEMAQLALQAGQGAEAKKIVEAGYAASVMGTGPDADRQNRLRALATKTAADNLTGAAAAEADAIKNKDGYALSNVGYNLVQAGQTDKGIALMEQALKMDNKFPEHAKLHLGMAYAQAGKKPQAINTWKTVGGKDGAADIARYWTVQTNHPVGG
jgi:tetratricopeptide (TPR) repeat protein